jgi:predicted phage terminase large subunit-like protein
MNKILQLSRAAEQQVCERSLAAFIRKAWHVVEPGQKYQHNWHVDFICEHLEAITDGITLEDGSPYNRLLINVPPGSMKSLLVNVFWPAWEWGPRNMPHLRYVCAAHKVENLSARDSRRMRELILSEWYQGLWGDRVQLARDQNEKLNFVNTAQGFRIATAMTSLTGIRGDRVIIDDPHSVDSAASEVQREAEITTFLEAIPSRLNNPKRSAIVVIMQRLHEEDISGVILDRNLGYDHIMLPMLYDPDRAFPTKLGAVDVREIQGELLFPSRFSQAVVDRDRRVSGEYAFAGQMQQSPSPRGGGIIPTEDWLLWDAPDNQYPPFDFIMASLDTSYGEKQESDYSAMTVWGVFSGDPKVRATRYVDRYGKKGEELPELEGYQDVEAIPKVMLMYAWQERLPISKLVERVAGDCKKLKVDKLLIESAAAGLSVHQEIRRLYNHELFGVQLIPTGRIDKVARLHSVSHLFAEGMIYAPDKDWAQTVINQVSNFPKTKYDDLTDTVSMALRHLREIGLLTRGPERLAEIDSFKRSYGKPAPPLYAV